MCVYVFLCVYSRTHVRVSGGAVALGHPIGSSGCRCVCASKLLHILMRVMMMRKCHNVTMSERWVRKKVSQSVCDAGSQDSCDAFAQSCSHEQGMSGGGIHDDDDDDDE
jgi:hypothetical protein